MGKKIKIAYLMHGIFYGGASRSLFLLLKGLDTSKYEPIVYTLNCASGEIKKQFLKYVSEVKLVKIPTISVNQVYKQPLYRFYLNRLKNSRKFIDLLLSDDIDILHINTTVFPQIPGLVKQYTHIKVVTHIREWMPEHVKGIISAYMVKNIGKNSDALIAISDNEQKVFEAYNNKLWVLPNPFDFSVSKTEYSGFREKYKIDHETVVVTMAAHFSPAKGHINFLKALKLLLHQQPGNLKVLFVIVGYKDKRTWWKLIIKKVLFMRDHTTDVLNFIAKNKLGKFVKLIPYTNKIFEIISHSDIMVRPAISADPWGRDIIEAMAFKKPVVAFGSSGFYIKNNSTGYLAPSGDIDTLSNHILKLAIDKPVREQFGENAYKIITEMCDINAYSASIQKIYKQLI